MKKTEILKTIIRMNKKVFGIALVAMTMGASLTACADKGGDGGNLQMLNASNQTSAAVPGGPVDLTVAAERAINSVVYIKVTAKARPRQQNQFFNDPFFEYFFGDPFGGNEQSQRGGRGQRQQQPQQQGAGSGVILTADGYIVTNNHVVENAEEVSVKLNDNREFKARIIGTDKTTDLALIKIDGKDLQPITIGNSEALKLGEWVLAIGNPYSLTNTVTAGIVSAKARSMHAGNNGIESFIQTDAAINPGNSGGALVNARGELVGINAMIYSQTGSYAGYGFAIPTTIMNKVVNDIKQYGQVQRAMLGVHGSDVDSYIEAQKQDGKDAPDLGTLTGIYVAKTSEDGAAAKAGIKEGDVILAVDGKSVNKFGELQEVLASHKPGDKVKVTIMRDKKKQDITVTLRNEQGGTDILEQVSTDDLGVALKPLTDEEKRQFGIDYGLKVTALRSGKMKDAGVQKGFIILVVNDQKMNTQADFDNIVQETNNSSERVLWIRALTPAGRRASFAIDLEQSKD